MESDLPSWFTSKLQNLSVHLKDTSEGDSYSKWERTFLPAKPHDCGNAPKCKTRDEEKVEICSKNGNLLVKHKVGTSFIDENFYSKLEREYVTTSKDGVKGITQEGIKLALYTYERSLENDLFSSLRMVDLDIVNEAISPLQDKLKEVLKEQKAKAEADKKKRDYLAKMEAEWDKKNPN